MFDRRMQLKPLYYKIYHAEDIFIHIYSYMEHLLTKYAKKYKEMESVFTCNSLSNISTSIQHTRPVLMML